MDAKVFELDLHGKRLTRIEGLEKFKSLRMLDVSCNQISKVEGLGSNKELRELKLYGNEIETLEGLERLTELCNLLLQHNKIRKIGKGLQNLRKLRSLRLDHNRLEVVSSSELASCGCHLTHLDLSHNHLTAVQGVVAMATLEDLKLGSNQLTQLPDLSPCKKLQELDISANPLSNQSLSRLANTRIKNLRLESIDLTDMTSLPKLKCLEEFHAANNKLSTLKGVGELFPNLELLDVRHNSLEGIQEVVPFLCKLCALSELLLEGNSLCSNCQDYRSQLKHGLPNLELLDGVSLSIPTQPTDMMAPLMRPLTPSSIGPSVRQMEHQLYEAEVHLENCCSGISAAFDMVQAKSDFDIRPTSQSSITPPHTADSASGRPGTRSGSRARLEDALAFASGNFTNSQALPKHSLSTCSDDSNNQCDPP